MNLPNKRILENHPKMNKNLPPLERAETSHAISNSDSSSVSSLNDDYLDKYSSDLENTIGVDDDVIVNRFKEMCKLEHGGPNTSRAHGDRADIEGHKSKNDQKIPVSRDTPKMNPKSNFGADPSSWDVPKAVLNINNRDDFDRNKKVLEYLKRLEETDEDIHQRLRNNKKVGAGEIESLKAAREAILKEYGYDFTDTEERKRREDKAKKRERRKNVFPSGVSVTSSSSECSDKPLKEEIVRRILNATECDARPPELELGDLMKHSTSWQKCADRELQSQDKKEKIEKYKMATKKISGRKKQ